MAQPEKLPVGLYDSLLTQELQNRIAWAETGQRVHAFIEELPDAEDTEVLAQHLHELIRQALAGQETRADRLRMTQRVLEALGEDFLQHTVAPDAPDNDNDQPVVKILSELAALPDTELATLEPTARPETALSEVALLTNTYGEPQVGAEIKTELASADRVDLLMAFVKLSGLNTMDAELARLKAENIPFRIITSTYLGASEAKAIHRLAEEYGGEVKINYAANATRLHAKAWLFHRNTGYSTAYIGSSNISQSALLDGLEWNVRLSNKTTPQLMRKFEAVFETYWAKTDDFLPYDPSVDQERLEHSLQVNKFRGGARKSVDDDAVVPELSGLEVRAYPFQADMLEKLEAERVEHGRHRNLLVAATGTGKTVIAGLDYRNLATNPDMMRDGKRPRLLFLAHRQEILAQSLRTFQEILADGNFGELLVGGHEPKKWDHVFASVQSLNDARIAKLAQDHFDVVIMDEFHHAHAPSYRKILDHFRPKELLGLTATPERGDGLNVAAFFDHRIAAEMRLWEALEEDILVPFHYFGIADTVDISHVEWKHGGYDAAQLSQLYTGNHARVHLILQELERKIADFRELKGLGFCVSVDHAHFMAAQFNAAGIASAVVVGTTSSDNRHQFQQDLALGTLKMLFVVDVYNEGVDIPSVNTILFLRPTESVTIFLQQLGRGLRRAPDKAVLTVLDFVGHQHKKFRFADRFRALTGRTRAQTERDVEHDFPFLPSGSQIVLDRQSKSNILGNIRQQLRVNRRQLVGELSAHLGQRSLTEYRLAEFLEETGFQTEDVYRAGSNGRSFSELKAAASGALGRDFEPAPVELKPTMNAWRLLHVDDEARAAMYRRLLTENIEYEALPPLEKSWARMLHHAVIHPMISNGKATNKNIRSYQMGLDWVREQGLFVAEALQVLEVSTDRARITPRSTALGAENPLRAHASYSRTEILAALDIYADPAVTWNEVSGVTTSKPWNADAFFINLHKSERDFSPSTMYRDYAISPHRFHWESPNGFTPASGAGQRMVESKTAKESHTLLFVRSSKNDDVGTRPFICLGTAQLHDFSGERPIQMVWDLDVKMPEAVYQQAKAVS